MNTCLKLLAATAASLMLGHAQAGVIEHADIGGIRTFQDTATGRIWADLDNYWHDVQGTPTLRYSTYGEYLGALQAAGFSWAYGSAVNAMLGTLPMGGGGELLGGYASVMVTDYLPMVQALRGIAQTGGPWQAHIGANAAGTAWFSSATLAVDFASSSAADRPQDALGGLWAYIEAPVAGVPEPGSAALALAGMAGLAWRRRAAAARRP